MSGAMRILWLTDFHFDKELLKKKDDEYLKNYFNSFYDTLLDFKSEITHVIISGDITQDGESQAFTAFRKLIFKRLISYLGNDVKYLFVPGNHDIEWAKYLSAYHDFNSKGGTFEEFFSYNKKKNSFLLNSVQKLFATYNTFILECQSVCEESNKGTVYSDSFFDEEYNTLFILINSAVNSFGEVSKQSLLGESKTNVSIFGFNATLEEIINNSSSLLNQQGQQTYMLTEHLDLIRKIDKEKGEQNYNIISVAHHNFDWLHHSEIFSDDPDVSSPIDKFFKRSNLHLTGHEHARPSQGYQIGNCAVIRSGMFFDGNAFGKNEEHLKFPNNWYSVISFSDSETQHEAYNYFYSEGAYIWRKHKETFKYNNRNKKPKGSLDKYLKEDDFLDKVAKLRIILDDFEKAEDKAWKLIENNLQVEFFSPERIAELFSTFQAGLYEELKKRGITLNNKELKTVPFTHLIHIDQKVLIVINLLEYSLHNEEDALKKLLELNDLYGTDLINYNILLVELFSMNVDPEPFKGSKIFEELKNMISEEVRIRNQVFEIFDYRAGLRLKEIGINWNPLSLFLFEFNKE